MQLLLWRTVRVVGLTVMWVTGWMLTGHAVYCAVPVASAAAATPSDAAPPFHDSPWTAEATPGGFNDGVFAGHSDLAGSAMLTGAGAFEAPSLGRCCSFLGYEEADEVDVQVSAGRVGMSWRRPESGLESYQAMVAELRGAGYLVPEDGWGPDAVLWMLLLDAHAGGRSTAWDVMLRRPPGMLHGGIEHWLHYLPDGEPRVRYADIRPGIDFLWYDSANGRELVFLLWPGVRWDRFRLLLENVEDGSGHGPCGVNLRFPGGEFTLGAPRTFRVWGNTSAMISESLAWDGRTVEIPVATVDPERHHSLWPQRHPLEPPLRLVPGGGQPDGPDYGFYLSPYPVTNEEFLRFLNDAQMHAADPRGTNMFFDASGNIWFNPAMNPGEHEIFRMLDSRFFYDADAALGQRYRIREMETESFGSYSNHPVVGVSWYGAVKYNNWLTLVTGRGIEELCYREGTNAVDWAPISSSATNWAIGIFTPAERLAWLDRKGFRLPMDDSTGAVTRAGAFNEYYKAAAWNGVTNTAYGFGRDELTFLDTNYRDNNWWDTLPVGYFDGDHEFRGQETGTNENLYGISDLSGNVTEWLSDPADTNRPNERSLRGGSAITDCSLTSDRIYAPPQITHPFSGFRVMSMVVDEAMTIVRIPYWICVGSYHVPAPEEVTDPSADIEPPPDPFEDFRPPVRPPHVIPVPPIPPIPPVPPIPPIPPPPVSPSLL